MLRSLSIYFLCFMNLGLYAQWPVIHNLGYQFVIPNYLVETYDKGFISTFDYKRSNSQFSSSAIFKMDVNGNQLWKKELNNENNYLQINGFALAENGSLAFCGHTYKYEDVRDVYIMKLNPCMEVSWCKVFRTPGVDDVADEMVYCPVDSSFIMTKWTDSSTETIRLMKVDSDGELIWDNLYAFNNPNFVGAFPLRLTYCQNDNSVIFSGFVDVQIDSLYWYQPYWFKISSEGEMLWERYNVPDSLFGHGFSSREPMFPADTVVVAPVLSYSGKSGYVKMNYLTGEFKEYNELYQPDSTLYGTLCVSTYLNDHIYTSIQYFTTGSNGIGCSSIQKTEINGSLIGETILPVNYTAVAYDLYPTSDDKLFLTASHLINQSDFMVIKYNENLEYDSIYTRPFNYDTLCQDAITSGTIQMNCDIVTGTIYFLISDKQVLDIYPNPTDDYCVIKLPEYLHEEKQFGLFTQTSNTSDYVKNCSLQVYDINGELVSQIAWPDHSKELLLNTSEWNSGLYIVRILKENNLIASGKILVN
ncbi:MAG TPA: T9SS type A sorting domain-containing protein [Lentimicrobium sp.]|nr:T9SS type A sorting domain-containing protein [Lentimicrobium sp.]